MSENVRIALITAAAAVLGGLVAAGAGVVTTVVNQQNENERAEQRLEREARGAARLLIGRFRVTRDSAKIMEVESRFRPFHPRYFTSLSARDLQLIDGGLSPDEFIEVDSALRNMDEFIGESNEGAWHRFGKTESEIIQTTIDKMDRGRVALLQIAGLPHYFKHVDQDAKEFDEEFPQPEPGA